MEAEVVAIGPFSVLRECDALSYPVEFYEGTPDNAIIVGIVAFACTRSEADILATTCNVEVWDLGHHKVTKPKLLTDLSPFVDTTVNEQCVCDVYDTLIKLLDDGVDLWFIPIG